MADSLKGDIYVTQKQPDMSTLPSTSPRKEDIIYVNKASSTQEGMVGSRYEFFCKFLAVVIVLVSFVFHLLRGAQGKM